VRHRYEYSKVPDRRRVADGHGKMLTNPRGEVQAAWFYEDSMMDDFESSQSGSESQPVNPSTPQPVQAAGDPAPPETLTPEELAAVLLARIDEIEAMVPNFQHHDKNDIRRVAGMARFAPELVVPTMATITAFGPAAERNIFDIAGAQLAQRRREAFAPVIQRLSALTDGMQFTVDSEQAGVASQALIFVTWAKSYAKRPDAAQLHPYVAAMDHVVKKVLNRRKPAPAHPGPTPAPATGSSQLPPGARGFLASNMVPREPVVESEPEGEDEYDDYFNEALDQAVKE
jgi:hypothetical protein